MLSRFATQAGVEVGERLIHQEQARIAHNRPRHRHPLPLAAGELRRFAIEQGIQLQHLRDFIHPRLPAGFSSLRTFMPKVMLSRTDRCGNSA
jgi:hypothetical protein